MRALDTEEIQFQSTAGIEFRNQFRSSIQPHSRPSHSSLIQMQFGRRICPRVEFLYCTSRRVRPR